MKYLTHYDNFVHYIDFEKLLKDFSNKNFTFFNTNAHELFIENNKHISNLFKDYEYNGEYIFIMLAFEMHVASRSDPQIIEQLFKKDIDLDKVYVITNNHTFAKNSHLKHIHFEFFEYAIQQSNIDIPHYTKCKNNITIDVNKKRHDKKFLCLNGRFKHFRQDLAKFFIDNDLLNQSSYSYKDGDITLTYDKKFDNYYYENNKPSMKKWKTKDLNVNLIFNEEFSYENSIYIITETFFNGDLENCWITEKTYKAMLWKMPFIVVGQPYTLKALKSLGYKTFNHMWNESYDLIIEPSDRMKKIQQLILNLSKRDVKKLISQNYEILEHNYNNLMSRRPEKELLETIRSLP